VPGALLTITGGPDDGRHLPTGAYWRQGVCPKQELKDELIEQRECICAYGEGSWKSETEDGVTPIECGFVDFTESGDE